MDRDPNIVRSGLSGKVTKYGLAVDVEIYRLESDPMWTLEVVDNEGGSTVWDDPFNTDEDALEAFRTVLTKEGFGAFTERKVIPFPKRP